MHGRRDHLLGRSLRALRRRRRTLLQRQPMHRIEDDLPRRLSGMRDSRRALLRGQYL
jgi:hypothetical protein